MTNTYDEKTVKKLFDLSAKMVTKLKPGITSDEKLKLYGLFKQSTIGDCGSTEPSKLFSPVDHAKWVAWNKNKGMNKYKAMDTYSQISNGFIDKYGIDI